MSATKARRAPSKRKGAAPVAARRRKPRGARGRRGGGGTLTVLHTCGHSQAHASKGKNWRRDNDAAWFATQPCTLCWSNSRAEEAEELCGVPNLPTLKGTERQIPWARTIRAQRLGQLKSQAAQLDALLAGWGLPPASQPFLDTAMGLALGERRAKRWIDEREETDAMRLFLPLAELHEFQRLVEQNQPAPF